MIISQNRIRSIERHFGFLDRGQRLILGVRNIARFEEQLRRAGFNLPPNPGDTVLPSSQLGNTSEFNAEGKYIVHKDQPKETAYRLVEWHWTEWRGRYDTEEMSRIVERPYKRYPRTFVSPPSIELTITQNEVGDLFVVSPGFEFAPESYDIIVHTTNLFLEIFGECEQFTEKLEDLQVPRLKRVNWEILPPGRYPWERLEEQVRPVIERAPEGNQPVIANRFETINSYNPQFHAIGRAGFWGYIVFGFPERDLYVFETAYYGNATYVFDDNWEELSQLSKAEILDEGSQTDRIIHREGWHQRIGDLFD